MYLKTETASQPGNSASIKIDVPADPKKKRIILVTAHGSSQYKAGGGTNAGITVSIECSGTNHVVVDDSFEGESSSITFNASATQMFAVDAGFAPWVKASVAPMGSGGKNNVKSSVVLTVAALSD